MHEFTRSSAFTEDDRGGQSDRLAGYLALVASVAVKHLVFALQNNRFPKSLRAAGKFPRVLSIIHIWGIGENCHAASAGEDTHSDELTGPARPRGGGPGLQGQGAGRVHQLHAR